MHLTKIGKVVLVDFAKNWSDEFGRISSAKWFASLAKMILPDCCIVRESVDSKRVASGGECGVEIDVNISGCCERSVVKSSWSILLDAVTRGGCAINEQRGLRVLESAVSSSRLSTGFDADGLSESWKSALE